jgi:hypothetical protein
LAQRNQPYARTAIFDALRLVSAGAHGGPEMALIDSMKKRPTNVWADNLPKGRDAWPICIAQKQKSQGCSGPWLS